MSDTPAGPDWWQASDGKWYPPEQHPDHAHRYQQPATEYGQHAPPYGTTQYGQTSEYGPTSQYGAPQYGQYGQYGQGQYGQYPPYGAYGYQPAPQTAGKAVGALVASILSFAVCPGIPAVVALVLASQASKEIAASNGRLTGEGMVTASRIVAIANLVLTALGIAFFIFIAVVASSTSTTDTISGGGFFDETTDIEAQRDLTQAAGAQLVYYEQYERFTGDPTTLREISPGVEYEVGSYPDGSGLVMVNATGVEVTLATESDSGECFYIRMQGPTQRYAHDDSCGHASDQDYASSW